MFGGSVKKKKRKKKKRRKGGGGGPEERSGHGCSGSGPLNHPNGAFRVSSAKCSFLNTHYIYSIYTPTQRRSVRLREPGLSLLGGGGASSLSRIRFVPRPCARRAAGLCAPCPSRPMFYNGVNAPCGKGSVLLILSYY